MQLTSTPAFMEESGKKRVVIAGGGYAGVTLAVRLAKKAKPSDNLDIILLEPNPCQQSLSELDLVAAGPPRPEFCELWLPALFKDLPVTVCYNRVHDVFSEEHKLVIGPREGPHEPVHYRRLVLATGAVAFVPPVPGLREHAGTMWSVWDAKNLQQKIETQFRKAA
ncbi:MAG TPA: FAD-dependent oxidoreductase, partial [Coriobacteriia bacterium]|nr:FAD-dependent oxidoreductase [Coriobacteriia bacterium]